MLKKHTFLFFIFCYFTSYAQEDFTFKGTVLNFSTQEPLEGAAVYLGAVKDSLKLNYTTTDKNGFFIINAKKNDNPAYLKISY